jgi:hypothetical protein
MTWPVQADQFNRPTLADAVQLIAQIPDCVAGPDVLRRRRLDVPRLAGEAVLSK